MADSINMQIADKLTERQLLAGRVESHLRREVWEQLRILEDEILSALKSSDPSEFALLVRRRREVQQLLEEEIEPLVRERYQHIAQLLDAAMMRLAVNEASAVQTIINNVTGEQTAEEEPSTSQLRAGVVRGLFPSAAKPTDMATFGSDWWVRQGESLSQRLGDSLLVGVSLEESLTQLTQRVRGTSENGFKDGIMARAKDDAARLLTTQTTNAVSEARVATASRNSDNLRALRHTSILDSKTSLVCLGRDGLLYDADTHDPLGHDVPYLGGIPYHPH